MTKPESVALEVSEPYTVAMADVQRSAKIVIHAYHDLRLLL
jgi:hypothetical protein